MNETPQELQPRCSAQTSVATNRGSAKDGAEMDRQNAPFQRIVESTPAAHFITDGRRFLYVNPAFEALTGYGRRELHRVDPCHFFSCAIGRPKDGENDSKESKEPLLRIEASLVTKDGRKRDVAITTTPITHDHAPALVGAVMDITEYKRVQANLKRSEMRYKTIFEFAPDNIVLYDSAGKVLDVNPEGLRQQGGWTREESVNKAEITDFWSDENAAQFAEIREQTMRHGEWHGEFKGVLRDGRLLDIESRVKVAELEGETVVVAIARDVTERKRMEEQIQSALREKEMLLREIHHRVKNNMQIISTLLRLQLRNAEDEKTRALFRESQNRILSMAMIHEKLYQSEGLHKIDLKDYITDLAREVFASFGTDSERISLRTDTEDISFGMDTAIPCGLIIIELVSNSLKHAFPGKHKGEIFVGLKRENHGSYKLTIADNGVGLPRDIDISRLKSLGFRLVSDLAGYQLKGRMDYSTEGGTTVHVTFQEKEDHTRQNAHE